MTVMSMTVGQNIGQLYTGQSSLYVVQYLPIWDCGRGQRTTSILYFTEEQNPNFTEDGLGGEEGSAATRVSYQPFLSKIWSLVCPLSGVVHCQELSTVRNCLELSICSSCLKSKAVHFHQLSTVFLLIPTSGAVHMQNMSDVGRFPRSGAIHTEESTPGTVHSPGLFTVQN